MASFDERTRFLENAVGSGKISAGITVHQPYAAAEHERRYYNHPRGGDDHYIENPLFAGLLENMRKIGREAVTRNGSNINRCMRDIADGFNTDLKTNAPLEFGTLRLSGNVWVEERGTKTYSKPQSARFRGDKE